MALTARQQQIRALIETRGRVTIAELAMQFEVSDETVRRDLKVLSGDGFVEKFHGGVRLSPPRSELPFEKRLREAENAKQRIARRAAAFIGEGSTVLLDNSTSACFLARELALREPMTVLTISLEVAQIFAAAGARHRLILPPGEFRVADRTITGHSTIDYIARFTPNFFVMSVVAGSEKGCHDFDLFETEFKQAVMPCADQVMALIDSSKFGKTGIIKVCAWDQVDVLVADAVPDYMSDKMDHGHFLIADGDD